MLQCTAMHMFGCRLLTAAVQRRVITIERQRWLIDAIKMPWWVHFKTCICSIDDKSFHIIQAHLRVLVSIVQRRVNRYCTDTLWVLHYH